MRTSAEGFSATSGWRRRSCSQQHSRTRGGEPLPAAARLRLDHGALGALLVPTATPAIRAALRRILKRHNALEEGPDGIYAAGELLSGDAAATLLTSLRVFPEVSVNPHVDSDLVEGPLPVPSRELATCSRSRSSPAVGRRRPTRAVSVFVCRPTSGSAKMSSQRSPPRGHRFRPYRRNQGSTAI